LVNEPPPFFFSFPLEKHHPSPPAQAIRQK
jgi:hypothetical protein